MQENDSPRAYIKACPPPQTVEWIMDMRYFKGQHLFRTNVMQYGHIDRLILRQHVIVCLRVQSQSCLETVDLILDMRCTLSTPT